MALSYRRVTLDTQLLDEALHRARMLPVFDGSHRETDANIIGCIGEVVFETFLERYDIPFEDHRDGTQRDYVINGVISIDVKTKDRTVVPRINYDNSVPLYNHEHQRPDYYYFVSLLRRPSCDQSDIGRFTTAFLLGGIDLETLDRDGTKWDTGQIDPSNGTTFWTACINVSMQQLISNSDMLELFRAARTD
jgi:hypothetical protein